jgi:hypothetical protein
VALSAERVAVLVVCTELGLLITQDGPKLLGRSSIVGPTAYSASPQAILIGGAKMTEERTSQPSSNVLLETNNPLDVTPQDLDELAELLEAEVPGSCLEIGYEDQHGAGVTANEVLYFWIPNAGALRDGVYVAMITATLGWLRERFKRKHSERRSKTLTVYDASTGKPLQTWVLRDSESEPVIQDPDPMRRPFPTRRARGRHER